MTSKYLTKDMDIKHLKEVTDLKFQLNDKVVQLEAKELERRLAVIEATNGSHYSELASKIEMLQKLVYIGVGGVLALQLVLKFIL